MIFRVELGPGAHAVPEGRYARLSYLSEIYAWAADCLGIALGECCGFQHITRAITDALARKVEAGFLSRYHPFPGLISVAEAVVALLRDRLRAFCKVFADLRARGIKVHNA